MQNLTDKIAKQFHQSLSQWNHLEPGSFLRVKTADYEDYVDDQGCLEFLRTESGWRCNSLNIDILQSAEVKMYTYYKLEVINWHHDGTPDQLQPIEIPFEVKKLSDIFGRRPRRERRLDEAVITDIDGSVYSSNNKEKPEFVLVVK